MIPFFPLFMNDCFVSLIGVSLFFSFFLFWEPDLFGNCDNLIFANPLSTPHHILPEWYFLIFYSCLRAFPNKTMGVIMVLLLFILLFLLLDCLRIACQDQFKCYRVFSSSYWENRIFFFYLFLLFIMDTWIWVTIIIFTPLLMQARSFGYTFGLLMLLLLMALVLVVVLIGSMIGMFQCRIEYS